jgi:hypothetical protein
MQKGGAPRGGGAPPPGGAARLAKRFPHQGGLLSELMIREEFTH